MGWKNSGMGQRGQVELKVEEVDGIEVEDVDGMKVEVSVANETEKEADE
jgi:hypothetical protein